MAINTAAKRRSAASVAGPPWLPGVTPDANKPIAWRQQAGWGYSGIPTTLPASLTYLGGIFRRAIVSTYRALRRAVTDRIFRGSPTRMAINSTLLPKDANETVLYVFDFGNFPEVLEGGTLSSPTVIADTTGLTIGSPSVTTVDHDGVQSGAGVEVLISSGTVGSTYTIECRVTIGSSVRVVKGRIQVE